MGRGSHLCHCFCLAAFFCQAQLIKQQHISWFSSSCIFATEKKKRKFRHCRTLWNGARAGPQRIIILSPLCCISVYQIPISSPATSGNLHPADPPYPKVPERWILEHWGFWIASSALCGMRMISCSVRVFTRCRTFQPQRQHFQKALSKWKQGYNRTPMQP